MFVVTHYYHAIEFKGEYKDSVRLGVRGQGLEVRGQGMLPVGYNVIMQFY